MISNRLKNSNRIWINFIAPHNRGEAGG